MRRLARLWWCAVLAAVLPTLGACKDDEPDFRTLNLRGTVEKIDLANKRVRISFFSERHGRNLTQEAQVTDQTEVFINGVVSRLEDVKEGEGAEGEVLLSGRGDDRVITVTRVNIRRAEPITATVPAEPSTQPAGPP